MKNIITYLNSLRGKDKKKTQSTVWEKPIILKWLNCAIMKKSLEVMDRKADYLLSKRARGKLKQWFLSDDRDFCNISAERYVIDYLRIRNKNINDNLKKAGIDAEFDHNGEKIGIEVTTINGFVSDWIFGERLPLYLKEEKFCLNNTLEISYSYKRINKEMKNHNIYCYIKDVGEGIIKKDLKTLKNLQVSCNYTNRPTGCIAWSHNNADDFPVIEYLTEGLIDRLKSKQKQLSQHKRNLVFVGVNHAGPTNWINPGIFEEIGCGAISYQPNIQGIENFLRSKLPKNIIGICYYNYSLERECPFYPLKIFWMDESKKIPINL